MNNVIIFYEHIVREYKSCMYLKGIFKEKGINAYVYSIAFEWIDAVKLSRKIKIDCVLMPWMYVDENYDLVQPFIKENNNVKIINLHHEQIGSLVSQNVLIPHTDNAKNQVCHFCWGRNFAEELIENGCSAKRVFITGNMRNDLAFKSGYSRDYLAKKYLLDCKKKWILFAETRTWVYDKRDIIKRDYLAAGVNENEFEEYRKVTSASLKKTIDEFNKIEDDFFKDFEIIYRPHPGQWEPEGINDYHNPPAMLGRME